MVECWGGRCELLLLVKEEHFLVHIPFRKLPFCIVFYGRQNTKEIKIFNDVNEINEKEQFVVL